jgi:ribose transport system substrate-binding protein
MTKCLRAGPAGLAVIALAVAGCGSSNDDTSTAASTGSSSGAAAGKPFTVGYSVPTAQNPWLSAIERSTQATIEKQGGKVLLRDAQLDPNRQVADIQSFVSRKVDAIVVGPAQVPQAAAGVLKQARNAGIPVIALEWDFSGGPPPAPVQGQAIIDRRALAQQVTDQIAKDTGGKAQIVYIGLPFPVIGVDTFYAALQKDVAAKGMKIVDRVNNPKDNAEGARPLIDAELTKNHTFDAIVSYNGPSALGAYQAAKAAGRQDKIRIYNIQLEPSTVAAVKSGQLKAVQWEIDPVALGRGLGTLSTAAARSKPAAQWQKTVIVTPKAYTAASLSSWPTWDSRIAALK